MTTRLFGSGIRRREDPRLITGRASYTDDISLPGMVYAAILRSPYAHANITSIDTSAAACQPGVIAVYTGADTEGNLNPIPCAWLIPDSDLKTPDHPAIAKDKVRYVGDAVGWWWPTTGTRPRTRSNTSTYYEPLDATINPKASTMDGAPQVHDDVPNNIAFKWTVAGGEIDEAFEKADVVVKDTINLQRLIPNAMEPRSAVAQYVAATGNLTLWGTTQNPHIARFLSSVVTGVGEHKVRVIAPEVGGGFGSKIPYYADEAITSRAMQLRSRQVRRRREAELHGTSTARHLEELEMAPRNER